jgi:AraC-like DNA-binding protein
VSSPHIQITILAMLVVCAGLGLAASIQLRRHHRQVRSLIQRLEALEAAAAESAVAPPFAPSVPPSHLETVAPPADVLAGKSSYVRAIVDSSGAEAATLTDRTIAAVHDRLDRNLLPQELASELDVSLRTLQRVLSSTLDCSPRQLILAMKMREARRLLLTGDLRVNEVAYRLGFSNPSHFSTTFRTFYRVTPSSLVRESPTVT